MLVILFVLFFFQLFKMGTRLDILPLDIGLSSNLAGLSSLLSVHKADLVLLQDVSSIF